MKVSNFKNIKNFRLFASRVLLLSALCVFIFTLNSKADWSPTQCNGDDNTPWTGPITLTAAQLPSGLIGCTDFDCQVVVKYYKRVQVDTLNLFLKVLIL